MNRRDFLSSAATGAVIAYSMSALPGFAARLSEPAEFSFDVLAEQARARAAEGYVAPAANLPEILANLDYDAHRAIRFPTENALWEGEGDFALHPFHPGWLFREPVGLHVVEGGQTRTVTFQSSDFVYDEPNDPARFEGLDLPGVAGFKLFTHLNRSDVLDELVAFLGASYFRALGEGSIYGISARGIAVNTATGAGEEFPRFDNFYVERPAPDATSINVWATLDGPSISGAFQFVIIPGQVTEMEVTARLFPRVAIQRLGIAPLTSMFLFAENNRNAFLDFRDAVHDSDGLKVVRADGKQIWRRLNNPARLATSFFGEENPSAFGLFQRDRDFANYQDTEAWYERRPSLLVEPLDPWGRGSIALIEIPTDFEVNDNIVAFWIPEATIEAGSSLEFRYRLTWGNVREDDDLARARSLRSGPGGVAGAENDGTTKKFVIDFEGGALRGLSADDAGALESVVSVNGGELVGTALSRIGESHVWRLAFDITPASGSVVELSAFLTRDGTPISESCLYQWRPEDDRAG